MPKSNIKTDDVKNTVKIKNTTAKKTVAENKQSAKKVGASKNTTAKTTSSKKTGVKKATIKKEGTTKKATTTKKTATANKSASTKKKTATKKAATASKSTTAKNKATTKKATATSKSTTAKKKTATKKATTASKSTTAKKKTAAKKATATSKSTTAKKKIATKKATTTKKKSTATKRTVKTKSVEDKNFLDIVEYYDLPYRYNQTVVKILAQNPNTLFIYWDVSDTEIENLKKKFGDNFWNITKPVLVIHNITNNYSFEIDINDFANNWYVNVNDTKCKYIVELGRRPIQHIEINNINNDAPTQFVKILSSNEIEIPNDHVLFYKDNQKLHFKNVKTNVVVEKTFSKKYAKNLSEIYKYFNLEDDSFTNKFDFANPSSNNPTSSFI